MDRSKIPTNARSAKSKITQHPPDLYALGSKPSSSNREVEVKRPSSTHPKLPLPSHSSLSNPVKDRKREGSSSSLPVIPPKKPKVFPLPTTSRPSSLSLTPPTSERFNPSTPVTEQWESIAIDSDESELVANVLNTVADNNTEKAIQYLLGGLKSLKSQKYKPELTLIASIGYIAKMKASLFRNENVTQALFALLRRDAVSSFKCKGNPQVPTLAVNLLMKGYEDVPNWPDTFYKYYLEDALGDRIWVDHELCTPFVDNIQISFNTRTPPKSLLQPELTAIGNRGDTGSPLTINDDELGLDSSNGKKKNLLEKCNIPVYPRHANIPDFNEMVLEAAKENLNRRQPPETVTKNFLKFLATACGLVEIRMLSVSKLEMWLHNAKLMRSAQDLLVYLCYNSIAETQKDIEVISLLIKIRFKTKALVNVFLNCLRDMISSHEENLPVILKHTIYNELSNARNPNNMLMIGVIFQTSPEHAANVLAEIFLELLLNKDDYLRPLRALLREIVRALRYDIDMYVFSHALIRERKDTTVAIRDFEFKDRMFMSIADLICLCMFLAVSPSVRDAANLLARGEKKELHTLQKFQNQVSKIQSDALWWLHETVPRMYRPNGPDFVYNLRKILLLDSIENYCKHDMWPSETDRNIVMRLCTEVPLSQSTLMRVLLIGLSKDHPIQQMETLDFCDPLIKRAAILSSEDATTLQFDKLEVIDLIFNLCAYHHPENITLPVGYTPPQLAISNLYWKGWIMLLILAAHNPTTFGNIAWDKYPMLRIFMEMCITNHFSYPPPTMAMCDNYEELKHKELQISVIEKEKILEFESHLAAASTKQTINESSSLLLSQLITMEPTGDPRRPPPTVLEQLRLLNASHRLGHLLCRSRRPDFLLDIIQRQGPSQHMPWLAELVQNSEGALSHLPVQCLCEFLLSSGLNYGEKSDRIFRQKHTQLVTHLHNLLTSRTQSAAAACEVLEYFLRRLSSPHYASRAQAIKGIKLVLQPVDDDTETEHTDDGEAWLMRQFALMPHFEAVRPQIILALRQACQVENDPNYISSYIHFLEQYSCMDSYAELSELVFDMAQLIVERSTIIAAILPTPEEINPVAIRTLSSCIMIYHSFLQKAKQASREAFPWSECQEHVLIQWANGEECIIQLLVIHAIVILLTYGPVPETETLYRNMLDQWFPIDAEPPKAYAIDTSEQLLYIPDWLKLRMIRSNVPRLVDAALIGLEQSKLMLFVQSFGIPIESMSKLLHALDVAVTEDQVAVAEAVLDKTYMAQLVEVQRRRGAIGGDIFVQALNLHEPPTADYSRSKFVYWRKALPNTQKTITANILNPQMISVLINAIFFNGEYLGNKQNDFDLLIKTLLDQKSNASVHIILKSVVANLVAKNPLAMSKELLANNSYSLKLFRTILSNKTFFSERNNLTSVFIDYVTQLYTCVKDYHCALTFVFKQIINISQSIFGIKKNTEETLDINSLKLQDPNEVLKNTNILTLERAGRCLLEQGLKSHNNTNLIEALAQRLIDVQCDNKLNYNPAGLLIDWLASIEPELIGSCPDLQMDLMFSINRTNVFRAYLQTLLVHRANWGTLHRCIGHLLADCNIKYDPTAVLDFLWALSRNPKLLQGRDKNTPKNARMEDMLELSQSELKSLVNYMLEESFIIEKQSKNTGASVNCAELRMPLLLQCIYDNPIAVSFVCRYLLFIIKSEEQKQITNQVETVIIHDDSNSWSVELESQKDKSKLLRKKIAEQFLLLMYLHIPRIIHYIVGSDRDKIFKRVHLTDCSSSTLDKISHCLLTALAATPAMKDWMKRSQEYEIMTRKMCATHPVLILRQLHMIAASLRGRAHLDFSVFRARNHLNLFIQVMGVVELLQPFIYMSEYQQGLENTLNEYFNLFKYHGRVKDLLSLLNRFIAILQAYINYDAKSALKFLQKHAHLLNDLQMIHSHVNSLRDLMTGILLPRSENEVHDEDGGDVLVAVIPPVAQEQLPQNWEQLTSNLNKLQGDDVHLALQDIDHLSNRKPGILESILTDLCRLMMSPTVGIRNLAHTLVLKHLKHNPADDCIASTVFTATMRCLDSSNIDIVVTTLERLPELVVCMQENTLPILEKVFTLGIGSDVNTATYISKTINLLNLQIGC